ncbi:MAG: hypothetical protein HGN29_09270 [Asgard group archaeon]|nr:hypothetical protein [Asgard group archaeon]
MKLRLSNKQVVIILLLVFFTTLSSGILTSVFDNKPFDLYIRIKEITWPPPSEFTLMSDVEVVFWVPMVCEIWNPSDTTYIHHTGNANLVDPQMKIKLKKDYPASAGYIFWIYLTKHEIKPGLTEIQAGLDVTINFYNASTPPIGTYTTWVGIVDEPELYGEPPFTFKSYKTVLKKNRFGYSINPEATPWNWGKITSFKYRLVTVLLWAFSGGELIAIMYFYRTNRELLVNVYFNQTNQRKKKNN